MTSLYLAALVCGTLVSCTFLVCQCVLANARIRHVSQESLSTAMRSIGDVSQANLDNVRLIRDVSERCDGLERSHDVIATSTHELTSRVYKLESTINGADLARAFSGRKA